jgi:lysine 2,3-aminomutase
MLRDLHAIPHVEVVRIGTRVPVVLPMRIDDRLADVLAGHRPLWVNTQFNHPIELTDDALAACERLVGRGIPVSNQAVLLRGVNDDVDTLRELCNSLQRNMIRPYYVFQCDPVEGTGHFWTDREAGIELCNKLRCALGGLAMPRFVADVPGSDGKTPLSELAMKGGLA